MVDCWHHAVSSAKQWGGDPKEYYHLHMWFDESKHHFADFRHRALRHHSQGIAEFVEKFGPTLELSTGRKIPVRWIGEQHVREDLGKIPALADWLRNVQPEAWMGRVPKMEIATTLKE